MIFAVNLSVDLCGPKKVFHKVMHSVYNLWIV